MNHYERIFSEIVLKHGIKEYELRRRIKLAQEWHNPLNYSNGKDLKEKYGWNILFTEALKRKGLGCRFYFNFKQYDLTDVNTCMRAFKNCKNWKKYVKVWKQYAPKEIAFESVYLLAMTEMTVKGFKHEKEVIEKYIEQGAEVHEPTFQEDYLGRVDVWVDGKPVQIKSEATEWNMKNNRSYYG